MSSTSRRLLALALALACLLGAPAGAPGADGFVVIVHPSVAGTSLRRESLAEVYFRRAAWGSGTRAVPVDQSATSAVRKAFSASVLRMSVDQIVQYWLRQSFASSQVRPPTVKGSDAEVIAFVAKSAGGVGYVAPDTPLPPGVKAVEIID